MPEIASFNVKMLGGASHHPRFERQPDVLLPKCHQMHLKLFMTLKTHISIFIPKLALEFVGPQTEIVFRTPLSIPQLGLATAPAPSCAGWDLPCVTPQSNCTGFIGWVQFWNGVVVLPSPKRFLSNDFYFSDMLSTAFFKLSLSSSWDYNTIVGSHCLH